MPKPKKVEKEIVPQVEEEEDIESEEQEDEEIDEIEQDEDEVNDDQVEDDEEEEEEEDSDNISVKQEIDDDDDDLEVKIEQDNSDDDDNQVEDDEEEEEQQDSEEEQEQQERHVKRAKGVDKDVKKKSTTKWVDEDDENASSSLKRKSTKLPTWVKGTKSGLAGADDYNHDHIEEMIFQNVSSLTTTKNTGDFSNLMFKKHSLGVQKSKVKNISVHNQYNLVMAGNQSSIQIYNPSIGFKKSLRQHQFSNYRINFSSFLPNTDKVLVTGADNHYHIYNIETNESKQYNLRVGNNKLKATAITNDYYAIEDSIGKISIISSKTNMVTNALQVSRGNVSALQFSPDSQTLYAASEGMISCFDLKTMRLQHRFKDLGNVSTQSITSLCPSPNGNYIASGSESGIINIYDVKGCMASETPAPLKSITSIVYPITSMSYDPTSKYLCAVSEMHPNTYKIIHHPTLSLVAPSRQTSKTTVFTSCAFDLQGYLLMGTEDNQLYHHTPKKHHKLI